MKQEEKVIFEEARTSLFSEFDAEISEVETEIHDLKFNNAKKQLMLDIENASGDEYTNLNSEFYSQLDALEKKLRLLNVKRQKLERILF
ncbi:hypothetical protein [Ruminiclostridium cellulolyticum]|nr:hypothetical protein [Ruminiclostridium cellulolyticum]